MAYSNEETVEILFIDGKYGKNCQTAAAVCGKIS
jgi:hypothetical protein